MVSADGKYNYNKAPLYNLQEVSIGKDNNGVQLIYGGDASKLCELLALSFTTSLDKTATSCTNGSLSYSETLFNTPSFTTNQGVQFVVGTETDGLTKYQTDIYVDLSGEKGNNCLYDAKKCKKTDRFKFLVSGDGHVIPADPAGQEYLKTRMNWRKTDINPDGEILAQLPAEWEVAPELITTSGGGGETPQEPEEPLPATVKPTGECPVGSGFNPANEYGICGFNTNSGKMWPGCPGTTFVQIANMSCMPKKEGFECPEGYTKTYVPSDWQEGDSLEGVTSDFPASGLQPMCIAE